MFPAITPGATDQSCVIHIMDSTDGAPEQAVEHDSPGIALWYWRPGGVRTTITPAALAALNSAHSDGGIEHIDDGDYRLDLPDAAVAAGVPWVQVGGVVTGMIIVGPVIPLNLASKSDVVDEMETQMAADPTGFKVNMVEVNETAQTAGDLKTLIDAVGTIAAAIQAVTDVIPNAGALTDIAAAIAAVLLDTGTDGVILKAAGLNADAAEKIATQISTQIGGILVNSTVSGDLPFTMRDSTNHALATGKTVAGQVNIDFGGFNPVTGVISEVALGYYKLAANATDRNGKILLFVFTSAGCDPALRWVITGS